MLFGMSASLAKPVVEELDEGLSVVLADWRAWALVVMGVVAFLIQQGALATGQLAPAVATTSLANPVVASIVGIVILEERLAGGLLRKSVAVGALVVAALCAIALAEHEQARGEEECGGAGGRAGSGGGAGSGLTPAVHPDGQLRAPGPPVRALLAEGPVTP